MSDGKVISTFPRDAVFILGAGRFGRRAAEVLSSRRRSPIWLIDRDSKAFRGTGAFPVSCVVQDASTFLTEHFQVLTSGQTIVPSVPFHLAFEWLVRHVGGKIVRSEPPREMTAFLPHAWSSPRGDLLVSYADFLCPEECAEPSDRCTVTGRARGTPLHERVSGVDLPGFRVHVIRSRQLAPGVGGYRVGDLADVLESLHSRKERRRILCTACRCHGIITAFRILDRDTAPRLP